MRFLFLLAALFCFVLAFFVVFPVMKLLLAGLAFLTLAFMVGGDLPAWVPAPPWRRKPPT